MNVVRKLSVVAVCLAVVIASYKLGRDSSDAAKEYRVAYNNAVAAQEHAAGCQKFAEHCQGQAIEAIDKAAAVIEHYKHPFLLFEYDWCIFQHWDDTRKVWFNRSIGTRDELLNDRDIAKMIVGRKVRWQIVDSNGDVVASLDSVRKAESEDDISGDLHDMRPLTSPKVP